MLPSTMTNRRTSTRTAAFPLMALSLFVLMAGCKSGTAGKVVTVTVDPSGVNVVIKKTVQFNATVKDTFNTAVTWTVAGGGGNGTISSTGLYTAPVAVPN